MMMKINLPFVTLFLIPGFLAASGQQGIFNRRQG